MRARSRTALQPTVERIEARELLSGITALLAHRSLAQAAIQSTGLNPGSIRAEQGSSTSPLLGQGQPTPHELARTRFRAVFTGPFIIGPGRYSDQSHLLFIRGVGGSTFFLHGNMDLGFAIPLDPTAPVAGEALLNDKNVNTSGILGLPLVADKLDRLGRPTHATFTEDANIYSGIFFVNTSSGTVDIGYHGGAATVVFNGHVYTSGLSSPLRNADLVARGGRLFTRTGAAPL